MTRTLRRFGPLTLLIASVVTLVTTSAGVAATNTPIAKTPPPTTQLWFGIRSTCIDNDGVLIVRYDTQTRKGEDWEFAQDDGLYTIQVMREWAPGQWFTIGNVTSGGEHVLRLDETHVLGGGYLNHGAVQMRLIRTGAPAGRSMPILIDRSPCPD